MEKKHPCPDCRQCQWCSDDRCRLCLKTGCGKKLSMAEQIELYEKLNAPDCPPPESNS
ncbi:hypothetical protein DSOUD_0720 [Desulfuromonas soudanensis]|uniref:Uncharacterized protein n=1 Tax=Desulfuromonas soudanensis TaxID=1603606 RepID=A0A0M4CZL9_9BACT|nr:hypothetical protein [Desulfuromonas soudanensis]ALC15508.1 hypothetical protein DSOUD_0720 [Desulfuromonas soudanensis]